MGISSFARTSSVSVWPPSTGTSSLTMGSSTATSTASAKGIVKSVGAIGRAGKAGSSNGAYGLDDSLRGCRGSRGGRTHCQAGGPGGGWPDGDRGSPGEGGDAHDLAARCTVSSRTHPARHPNRPRHAPAGPTCAHAVGLQTGCNMPFGKPRGRPVGHDFPANQWWTAGESNL